MLVQQLSFNRQPIVVPLLLKMYESPLSGAEPVVLYPRQHQHIVFAIHYYLLYKFLHSDVCGQAFLVNGDIVVAEGTRSTFAYLFHLHQIKQFVGRCIAKNGVVLEDYEFLRTHKPTCCRTVHIEHIL